MLNRSIHLCGDKKIDERIFIIIINIQSILSPCITFQWLFYDEKRGTVVVGPFGVCIVLPLPPWSSSHAP
jgi:hypothetical protein